MGFLEALAGFKKVLTCQILFGSDLTVGVKIQQLVPQVPGPDFIRLWACYEAKIIYNLGYPQNLSATMEYLRRTSPSIRFATTLAGIGPSTGAYTGVFGLEMAAVTAARGSAGRVRALRRRHS